MRFLKFPREPLRGSAWSRCKNSRCFAISPVLARPSAGIGVVEVQKLEVFCNFCGARATLCGNRRGRGAKTRGFLQFLKFPRDPLRGSAWSRCKNSRFFAISKVPARPSAGIGVVVQKLEAFCVLRRPRNALRESAWWRCKNSRFLLCELVLESCLVVRAPAPGPAGRGFDSSLVRGRASQDATCILKQLAQSNLHRATCADQLAPTSLRRAPCLEQLAQSNLRRATCTEQLAQSSLHRAACTEQLVGSAICTEQLAGSHLQGPTCRSNLRGATCAEQLAQTNLHRPVCAEHLAWCCLALASQMLRGGKKNASCSVGPTSLAMLCFRANRGLANRGLVIGPKFTMTNLAHLVFQNSFFVASGMVTPCKGPFDQPPHRHWLDECPHPMSCDCGSQSASHLIERRTLKMQAAPWNIGFAFRSCGPASCPL